MKILSLQSNVTRDVALQKLAPGFARQWLGGRLAAAAELYIPYRLYEVIIEDRRLKSTKYYGVDAATGTLDPYAFTAAPAPDAFVEVVTRNCHPARLEERLTSQLARAAAQRSIFHRGFFRLADLSIAVHFKGEFYLPYWAGFYSIRPRAKAAGPGEEQMLKLAVINAVRGSYEGGKVRKVIQEWLMDGENLPENEFATQRCG